MFKDSPVKPEMFYKGTTNKQKGFFGSKQQKIPLTTRVSTTVNSLWSWSLYCNQRSLRFRTANSEMKDFFTNRSRSVHRPTGGSSFGLQDQNTESFWGFLANDLHQSVRQSPTHTADVSLGFFSSSLAVLLLTRADPQNLNLMVLCWRQTCSWAESEHLLSIH